MLQKPDWFHSCLKTLQIILASFILASVAQPLAGQPHFTVHDLGTLGGSGATQPNGISHDGQVVGFAFIGGNQFLYHAFRTDPNRAINPLTDDLGTLGGQLSSAAAINRIGQVAGTSGIPSNSFVQHAFRTAPHDAIHPATDDLGTLGGDSSSGTGINDRGQVIGFSLTAGNSATHAFRTAPNRPINPATDDLGTLGGSFSQATGVNNLGQVAGFSTTSQGATHAFLTAPDRVINPATDDLGTLGANALASAVGRHDHVVGYSFPYSSNLFYFHAFLANPGGGTVQDLGALGPAAFASSGATGINRFGQIVGYSQTSTGEMHAFLYMSGKMHDLNDLIPANSGWVLQSAYGINDAGQIIGTGVYNGQPRAFRLIPSGVGM